MSRSLGAVVLVVSLSAGCSSANPLAPTVPMTQSPVLAKTAPPAPGQPTPIPAPVPIPVVPAAPVPPVVVVAPPPVPNVPDPIPLAGTLQPLSCAARDAIIAVGFAKGLFTLAALPVTIGLSDGLRVMIVADGSARAWAVISVDANPTCPGVS
jgi:hypothetical protein